MIKIRKGYYAIIAIVMLVLIGLGIFYIVMNNRTGVSNNTSSTQTLSKNGLVKSIDNNTITVTDINTQKDLIITINDSTIYRSLNTDNQFEVGNKNILKVGSLIIVSESQSGSTQTIDILN